MGCYRGRRGRGYIGKRVGVTEGGGGGRGYIGKRVGVTEGEGEGIYRKEGGCYRGGGGGDI